MKKFCLIFCILFLASCSVFIRPKVKPKPPLPPEPVAIRLGNAQYIHSADGRWFIITPKNDSAAKHRVRDELNIGPATEQFFDLWVLTPLGIGK